MYALIQDGKVVTCPYNIGKLQKDNPNTSFPKKPTDALLSSFDMQPVTIADLPSYTKRTQWVTQNTSPTLVDEVWVLGWTVSDKTTDEIAEYDAVEASTNRGIRNSLLVETDFYALSDVTMSSDMTTYRQALRDLPSHSNWPNLETNDWPTKP